tara:strand:- start:28344 stop:29189 length:846 start_codon:yes stop_codon:yes gene_type:complete
MNSYDINSFIENSLKEDIGSGDHTTLATINKNEIKKAHILVKQNGIIAGVELAKRIFKKVDKKIKLTQYFKDGKKVNKGDIIFEIIGSTHSILKSERLILNCMQRMSSIASHTNEIRQLLKNTETKILDTRKTTPLNRLIEKWAVRIGGGINHRFGLYDMIMIKDNHIDFVGNVKNAITNTKKYIKNQNLDLKIIVEARNLNEVNEIIQEGGINRILLDNFNYQKTKEAVKIINGRYETESSGNITQKNVLNYAKCGVDYVSMGALTNSIKTFDISLKSIK